ncbi:proline-rich protein 11 isoform X1 [Xenopus laevis]|uniref:Proline-rich protein 11 isoform X1 n=1 Tax=Xenopus laevis TaxID=8355 RepID=A0A8J1M9Z9_XENLA|nr:proline-rich protein 11 isoform X1 [Xenopus laevis]
MFMSRSVVVLHANFLFDIIKLEKMAKFIQARRRPGKHRKKLWQVKKSNCSRPSQTLIPDQVVTSGSWHLNLLLVGSFISLQNTGNFLVNAFLSLYWWSHNRVKKHLLLVKNTIFPPIIYHRELRALRQRLQKLEAEFSMLQTSFANKIHETSLTDNTCCRCGNSKTITPIIPLHSETANQSTPTLHPPLPPPLPPPPAPPLPPPPPPVLATSFPLKKSSLVREKTESAKIIKDDPLRQSGPVQIRLKDILNVRLKKTKDLQTDGLDQKTGLPPVSLSELQGLNLKMASKMVPRRLANIFKEASNCSPLDLRRRLKKVNMVRSPGGTPLYNRDNKENGTGLNPLMTKALRQKFQMAHPKSPSPLRSSPGNRSFEELP